MSQNDDAETSDHGSLEGGGSGGGSRRVQEQREGEQGGSKALLYLVIAIVAILAIFPVVRIFGVAAESRAFVWLYAITGVLALLIVVPFIYGLIKKST